MSTDVPTAAARMDTARAVVLPGPGAVVRLPGLLGLLRLESGNDTEPGDGQGSLARLVEICTEITGTGGAPGRPLARRLARWLGSLDPGPDLGIVSATDDGVALFLHGAVDAVLGGQRYSAADSGAWLDRLLPHPGGPLVLLPTEHPAPENHKRAVFDLRGGVVPAGAVLLLPRSGPVPVSMVQPGASVVAPGGRSASVPRELPAVPDEPAPVTADDGAEPAARPRPHPAVELAPAVAATPRRVAPILGFEPDEPPRPPLAAGEPHISARSTSRHRIEPTPATGLLAPPLGGAPAGARPPAGVLVFDDGSRYPLDADYLLGRMPESDPRVQRGQLRALPVDDPEAQISRGHLVIKLDGWDVCAIDESRNGTLIARPSEESWSRLTPRHPLRLVPGTRVRVGGRTFVFEAPSGTR